MAPVDPGSQDKIFPVGGVPLTLPGGQEREALQRKGESSGHGVQMSFPEKRGVPIP